MPSVRPQGPSPLGPFRQIAKAPTPARVGAHSAERLRTEQKTTEGERCSHAGQELITGSQTSPRGAKSCTLETVRGKRQSQASRTQWFTSSRCQQPAECQQPMPPLRAGPGPLGDAAAGGGERTTTGSPTAVVTQLGTRSSHACARAWSSNESPLQAGLELLVGGGMRMRIMAWMSGSGMEPNARRLELTRCCKCS